MENDNIPQQFAAISGLSLIEALQTEFLVTQMLMRGNSNGKHVGLSIWSVLEDPMQRLSVIQSKKATQAFSIQASARLMDAAHDKAIPAFRQKNMIWDNKEGKSYLGVENPFDETFYRVDDLRKLFLSNMLHIPEIVIDPTKETQPTVWVPTVNDDVERAFARCQIRDIRKMAIANGYQETPKPTSRADYSGPGGGPA